MNSIDQNRNQKYHSVYLQNYIRFGNYILFDTFLYHNQKLKHELFSSKNEFKYDFTDIKI